MRPEFDIGKLEDLYREIILDHYRYPRNRGHLDHPDLSAEGMNPFCGDEITIELKLNGAGQVKEVVFRGRGCSISQASVSMLTEKIKGKTLDETLQLSNLFKDVMHGKELSQEELEQLGDLVALEGVRKFPIRIKCALLGWAALEEVLSTHKERDKG